MGEACCKMEKGGPDGARLRTSVGGGSPRPPGSITPGSGRPGLRHHQTEAEVDRVCMSTSLPTVDTSYERRDESDKKGSTTCTDFEWLNVAIAHMWPSLDQVANTVVEYHVIPKLKENLPDSIIDVKFTRLTLGHAAPVIGPVKVTLLPARASRVRCTVQYTSDMHVEMSVKSKYGTMEFGIKDMSFYCDVVLRFRPNIEQQPDTGGVSGYLLNEPFVDFDFTGAASVVNTMGLKSIVLKTIENAVSAKIVMPNIVTKLISYADLQLSPFIFESPEPLGLLRVKLLEASTRGRNTEAKQKAKPTILRWASAVTNATHDFYELIDDGIGILKGVNTEPYLRICVGDQAWKPDVKDSKKNPSFEFVVFDPEQCLHVSLWDRDASSADDLMATSNPMQIKEASDKSGEELLLDGIDDDDQYPVKMDIEWLLATPGMLNSGGCIVVICVREIRQMGLPGLVGEKFCLRAKLGQQAKTTPPGTVQKQPKDQADVASMLAEVRTNLEKASIPKDEIEKILDLKTGLTRMAVNSSLHFVCEDDIDNLNLEFVIVDLQKLKNKLGGLDAQKNKACCFGKSPTEAVVGTYVLPLWQLQKMPQLHFPGPISCSGRAGDLEVEVSVTLCGLAPAPLESPGSRAKTKNNRASINLGI